MINYVQSWKIAGDEMERLRNERLQKMASDAGARMMGAIETKSREEMYANGLARWQSWMMRLRTKQLQERENLRVASNRDVCDA